MSYNLLTALFTGSRAFKIYKCNEYLCFREKEREREEVVQCMMIYISYTLSFSGLQDVRKQM